MRTIEALSEISIEDVRVGRAPSTDQTKSIRRTRRTWSMRTSFWLVVGAQVLLLTGSNFPTPLFPIYEQRYGFSSGVVTALFGVYVFALIPTMLTIGRLADRLGRRPMLVFGIAITAVSSLAFAVAHGVGWLFAGEIIYGIGGGMVMSAAAVTIRELHPKQNVASGALAATLAAAAGLTLGPLVSGLLATVTPWPTVSPFVLDIALAAVLVFALVRIPESRPTAAPADVSVERVRAAIIQVPADIRAGFIATALSGAAGWMLVGWVFALAPSFLHEELGVHITQPFASGLFAAGAALASGATQVAFRRRTTAATLRGGLLAIVTGMATITSAAFVHSFGVAVAGAALAGAGTGVTQMTTMATIQRIAPVHARSAVTSAYLTICYLALSVPVLIAGVTADRFGLRIVTVWYLVGLALLIVAASLATARAASIAAGDVEVIELVPIDEFAA